MCGARTLRTPRLFRHEAVARQAQFWVLDFRWRGCAAAAA